MPNDRDLSSAGKPMRTYIPRHPTVLRDLTRVFNSGAGRKIRSECRGISAAARSYGGVMASAARIKSLRYKQQHREPWRKHQSLAFELRGPCAYSCCPGQGIQRIKKRDTNMRCEECSELLGRNIFLCNGTHGLLPGEKKKYVVINCHEEYHRKLFNKK